MRQSRCPLCGSLAHKANAHGLSSFSDTKRRDRASWFVRVYNADRTLHGWCGPLHYDTARAVARAFDAQRPTRAFTRLVEQCGLSEANRLDAPADWQSFLGARVPRVNPTHGRIARAR